MGVTYRMFVSIPTTSHYINDTSDHLRCGRAVTVGWPFGKTHGRQQLLCALEMEKFFILYNSCKNGNTILTSGSPYPLHNKNLTSSLTHNLLSSTQCKGDYLHRKPIPQQRVIIRRRQNRCRTLID